MLVRIINLNQNIKSVLSRRRSLISKSKVFRGQNTFNLFRSQESLEILQGISSKLLPNSASTSTSTSTLAEVSLIQISPATSNTHTHTTEKVVFSIAKRSFNFNFNFHFNLKSETSFLSKISNHPHIQPPTPTTHP